MSEDFEFSRSETCSQPLHSIYPKNSTRPPIEVSYSNTGAGKAYLPYPPAPAFALKDFVVYTEQQLLEDSKRKELLKALHAHHLSSTGARKHLYVHGPSIEGSGSELFRAKRRSEDVPNGDSTFCLSQHGVGSGEHRCSRVAIVLRNVKISRFSSYRASSFGSLHVPLTPGADVFLHELHNHFLIPQSNSCPREIKIRCEVDDNGFPTWTTEDVFYSYDKQSSHSRDLQQSPIVNESAATSSDSSSEIFVQQSSIQEASSQQPLFSSATPATQFSLPAGPPSPATSGLDDDFLVAVKRPSKVHQRKKVKEESRGPDIKQTLFSELNNLNAPNEDFSPQQQDQLTPDFSVSKEASSDLSVFPLSIPEGSSFVAREEILQRPCANDEEIVGFLRSRCVPFETEADIVVHVGNICPYQQSSALILYLVSLRLYHRVGAATEPFNEISNVDLNSVKQHRLLHPTPTPKEPSVPSVMSQSSSVFLLNYTDENPNLRSQANTRLMQFSSKVSPLTACVAASINLHQDAPDSTDTALFGSRSRHGSLGHVSLDPQRKSEDLKRHDEGSERFANPQTLRLYGQDFSLTNRGYERRGSESRSEYLLEGRESEKRDSSLLRNGKREKSNSGSAAVVQRSGSSIIMRRTDEDFADVDSSRRKSFSQPPHLSSTNLSSSATIVKDSKLVVSSADSVVETLLDRTPYPCSGLSEKREGVVELFDCNLNDPLHPRNVKQRLRECRHEASRLGTGLSQSSSPSTVSACFPSEVERLTALTSNLSVDEDGVPIECNNDPLATGDSSDLVPFSNDGFLSVSASPDSALSSDTEFVCCIGDFVEIEKIEGRRDILENQRGEVITLDVDPDGGILVTLILCRADGKRYHNQQHATKSGLPLSCLRLIERAGTRTMHHDLSGPGASSTSSGTRLTDSFYLEKTYNIPNSLSEAPPHALKSAQLLEDISISAGHWKQQLVAAPFSLRPERSDRGVLCFFWDLESTGLHVNDDDITQIACVCRRFHFGEKSSSKWHSNNGSCRLGLEEALGRWEPVDSATGPEFNCYVRTDREIPQAVIELTGITNGFLNKHGVSLSVAMSRWSEWILSIRAQFPESPVWFIAHNGNRFDLPLLFQQEEKRLNQPAGTFLNAVGVSGIADTVILSRRLPWACGASKRSHKLQALYQDLCLTEMPNEHDALGDVLGLATLMEKEPFLTAWRELCVGWSFSEYLSGPQTSNSNWGHCASHIAPSHLLQGHGMNLMMPDGCESSMAEHEAMRDVYSNQWMSYLRSQSLDPMWEFSPEEASQHFHRFSESNAESNLQNNLQMRPQYDHKEQAGHRMIDLMNDHSDRNNHLHHVSRVVDNGIGHKGWDHRPSQPFTLGPPTTRIPTYLMSDQGRQTVSHDGMMYDSEAAHLMAPSNQWPSRTNTRESISREPPHLQATGNDALISNIPHMGSHHNRQQQSEPFYSLPAEDLEGENEFYFPSIGREHLHHHMTPSPQTRPAIKMNTFEASGRGESKITRRGLSPGRRPSSARRMSQSPAKAFPPLPSNAPPRKSYEGSSDRFIRKLSISPTSTDMKCGIFVGTNSDVSPIEHRNNWRSNASSRDSQTMDFGSVDPKGRETRRAWGGRVSSISDNSKLDNRRLGCRELDVNDTSQVKQRSIERNRHYLAQRCKVKNGKSCNGSDLYIPPNNSIHQGSAFNLKQRNKQIDDDQSELCRANLRLQTNCQNGSRINEVESKLSCPKMNKVPQFRSRVNNGVEYAATYPTHPSQSSIAKMSQEPIPSYRQASVPNLPVPNLPVPNPPPPTEAQQPKELVGSSMINNKFSTMENENLVGAINEANNISNQNGPSLVRPSGFPALNLKRRIKILRRTENLQSAGDKVQLAAAIAGVDQRGSIMSSIEHLNHGDRSKHYQQQSSSDHLMNSSSSSYPSSRKSLNSRALAKSSGGREPDINGKQLRSNDSFPNLY